MVCLQTGAWVVTLEGWCRVYVEDAPREGRQKFLLVSVEQAGPSKDVRCSLTEANFDSIIYEVQTVQ